MADSAVKIPFTEAAAPSTPATGKVVIYAKTDGLLYSKDDAGTETLVSGGAGGGSVATDAIWDAAGDLAVGSGANTAARLAIGAAGLALVSNGTTAAWGVQNAHGCRVKRASGDFSVGNNTLTAVEFTAEDLDTDTMHDNSTNPSRVTIPTISGVTTGLWSIKASGYTDATSGRVDVSFRKNAAGNPASGTPLAFDGFTAAAVLGAYHLTTDAVFTAGDYVECFVRTTAGAGNAVYDADVSPIMTVAFLGKVT